MYIDVQYWTFRVSDKPVISFGEFNPLVVIEKSDVVLTCEADANPEVLNEDYTWEKDGENLGMYINIDMSSSLWKEGFTDDVDAWY